MRPSHVSSGSTGAIGNWIPSTKRTGSTEFSDVPVSGTRMPVDMK
jgi:hypothetical protein